MRTKTANWYECAARYEKTLEDGTVRKVTEPYVVKALSFGEAEKRAIKEIGQYVRGNLEIRKITPAAYQEIFFSEADCDDKWYKAKLRFVITDEKTQKEKKTTVTYLVQGATLDKAMDNIMEVMGTPMVDYENSAIAETNILDVFE